MDVHYIKQNRSILSDLNVSYFAKCQVFDCLANQSSWRNQPVVLNLPVVSVKMSGPSVSGNQKKEEIKSAWLNTILH